MLNQYPLWKYVLIAFILVVGIVYALPNIYGQDPAVQVSGVRGAQVTDETRGTVEAALERAGISYKSIDRTEQGLLVRFDDTETQLRAQTMISAALSGVSADYSVALNLAPSTPEWLQSMNAKPMFLGLDLRGGIHFLMDVDMPAAVDQAVDRYVSDLRASLREEGIRYKAIRRKGETSIEIGFRDNEGLQQAAKLIERDYQSLEVDEPANAQVPSIMLTVTEAELREIRDSAVKQNITTLRNRVNLLGVSEPVIQQQGEGRIVVQLPGVQDTARAKDILGATATLEFRLVDEGNNPQDALAAGRAPLGTRLYRERNGNPILLDSDIIVTGDQIINAASGFDPEEGSPSVNISLDARGADRMLDTTKENVGRLMAVVFIENRPVTRLENGQPVQTKEKVEEVINVARIREPFSKRFQITGLDSSEEAHTLALLLRAGSLKAPMDIVEERTVGPSLGRDNIRQGFNSVMVGLAAVLVFMLFYYRVFGLVANIALVANLVLMVAALSILQATLTLPGIAGIVLTVGMAVDANVLIYERIREELRNGNSPQASIHAGYEKALSSIADANITTLIAALVLLIFGTGPIKGFAWTLSIGIVTSMFTAIMGTRAIVNLIYGGKRVTKLAI